MNKKTLIILVTLFIILAALILAYFFIFKETSTQQNTQGKIEKDGFIIDLPEGWGETEAVSGSLATAFNSNELINNENAQKVGFRSYYSVIYDVFSEENNENYLKKIKNSLQQSFPEVKLSDGESQTPDGTTIYYIEADLNQQDIDFKVLLAVNIKNNDVWIISFNTLKENWEGYKNLFYQIAENFKIK